MELTSWAVIIVLIASVAHAFGGLYLKKGADKIESIFSFFVNKNLAIGTLFYTISTILAVPAYRFGQLSVLYPLYATSYIWVTIFGVYHMNETMTRWKYIGIACILIGVIFIGVGA